MNLFLDTSVALAACGSSAGASRARFDLADPQGWVLQTSRYVLGEVSANLSGLLPGAAGEWARLRSALRPVPDVVTFEWATILAPAKDRPILFTAAAWSDVLLTLDQKDFAGLLGAEFYGLPIMKPGEFLRRERAAGRLEIP